jgi:mono/diheme cytochrome c family protein
MLALALLGDPAETAVRPAEGRGPFTADAGSKAASLYRRHCQQCHGADGTGAGARGTGIAYIPNFAHTAWHRKRQDGQLLSSILDGKGSHMPAFDGKLSRQEAQHLVSYVRAFGAEAKPPAELPPTDFDRRFRQLEEEMRELRRQFREAWSDGPTRSASPDAPARARVRARPSQQGGP